MPERQGECKSGALALYALDVHLSAELFQYCLTMLILGQCKDTLQVGIFSPEEFSPMWAGLFEKCQYPYQDA